MSVTNSGDARGVESINTKAIQYLVRDNSTYISRSAAGQAYTACSTPVLFRSVYNVTASNVWVSDTECLSSTGTGGLAATGTNTGDFRIANATFIRLTGAAPTIAACLHLQTSGSISVTDLTAQNTTSSRAGCVRLTTTMPIYLLRVVMANSRAEGGQLQLASFQNVTIIRAKFTSNTSTKEAGVSLVPVAGVSSAYVKIVSSRFEANTGLMGTGVYVTGDVTAITPVTLQVTDCPFVANAGSLSGSGILVDDSSSLGGNSYIRNCQFVNHTVNEAVLYFAFQQGSLELTSVLCSGSVLDPSTSTASLSSVGCVFGEFKSSNDVPPVIYIADSWFEGNQGVAMISISSANGLALLVSRNNTFLNNRGRGIFVDRAQMRDSNSTIQYNKRAGFYLSGESVCNVTNTSFLHNYGKMSGALYLGGTSVCRLTACFFLNNSADSGNGAIYVEQSSQIVLDDSTCRQNVALGRGAAISLFGTDADNSVTDTVFEDNENVEGGTILTLSSSLRLSNVTVRGNKGAFAPGILSYFSDVHIDSSVFSDQYSESGSFLYISVDSNVSVTFSSFSNAYSTAEGGALYLLAAQLYLHACQFSNLTADRGALLYASSTSSFLISDSTVTQATSLSVQGGVIYTVESFATVVNTSISQFTNNGVVGVNQKQLSLSAVSLSGNSYAEGSGKQGGGVFCSECTAVEMVRCSFVNLTAEGGAALYVTVQQVKARAYSFKDCVFENNAGSTSGAIYFSDVSADVQSCVFANNTARTGSGGAFNLQCPSLTCAVYFTSSMFSHNSAAVQGGSISWSHLKPVVTTTTFSDGSAVYGRDLASFPVRITIKSITGNATVESLGTDSMSVPIEASIQAVASGQLLDCALTAALLDHYGQIVFTENSDTASLLAPAADQNVLGNISVGAVNGTFVFKGFAISASPETDAVIYVVSASLGSSGSSSNNDTYSNKVAIRAFMRECVQGESHLGTDCVVCPEGKYSFDPTTTCQECLASAVCLGNYTMVPKQGYWRANVYSARFYDCPNPDACIGSPLPPDPISLAGECQQGYYGNLCNGCLSEFSRQNQNECLPCPSFTINTIRMGGIAIGVFIALIVIVKTAINSAKKQRSYYSIFIKIMLNYLQLVMLTAAFQMKWPSYMKELFKIQQSAGNVTEQIFAVDCFFSTGSKDSQALAVRMKLVGIGLSPLVLIGISFLIWAPVSLVRKKLSYLKNELMTTIVVCFFLIHPSIVKFMFSFMYCRELEPGQFWMNDYLNIPCWDYAHYRYVFIVVLPSIASWGVGVPMLCLLVLYRNRNRLSLLELKLRLGFVYNGYEYSKYYWEFVILYRKILIITVAVFLTNISTSIQALTVMMLLIAAFSLQIKHKPFAIAEMNDLEVRGILVSAVTIYCGLYYMTNDLDQISQVIMFVIVLVVNAYFLVLWCVRVFHAGFQVIKRRCPCLIKFLSSAHYKVQPNAGLTQVKVGSSVSRSQFDSAIVDGESVDLSRFYDSESLNDSNARRRPVAVTEPKLLAPDNSPGSGSGPSMFIP